MQTRCILAIALVAASVAGCSSTPSASPEPGALAAGTAQVIMGDQNTGPTYAVTCQSIQSITTVTIKNAESSVVALIDNAKELTADSVSMTNVGGFTGSYQRDAQGSARINMSHQAYTIAGTAEGFISDRPTLRTQTSFTIRAAC
jgi:hypothetical protein